MNLKMNPKIFIVDDDLFCQAMYEQEILNLGFDDVSCFSSGTELLNQLSENPDLIFLDYNLEDYKGLEMLNKIKTFNPEICVVVISGQTEMEITVQLMNIGAFDYIIKDEFETAKITRVIGKWLSACEMNESLKSGNGDHPAEKYLKVITAAEEKVRKEISGELHDNVNQLLGASKLYMDIAFRDNENRLTMIQESQNILNSAITEVRKLSHSLQSVTSRNTDLSAELNKLISRLKLQNDFKLTTAISIDELKDSLPSGAQFEVFRIIQEQVNNIVKYAQAKQVHIGVMLLNGELQLEVSDDGVGFDLNRVKKGLGLENIINRVSNIQGTYTINTAPGLGCTWNIYIPLKINERQTIKQ